MRFKYTIVLDKRRKLQSGKYPIKVNIHSYADNKNHYVSIQPLFTARGKIEISCENQKEFDSVWTNRHKKDSFGNVIGETTVYGNKLELRNALKIQNDRLTVLMEDNSLKSLAKVKDWIKNWDAKEDEVETIISNLYFKIQWTRTNWIYCTRCSTISTRSGKWYRRSPRKRGNFRNHLYYTNTCFNKGYSATTANH